jgi:PAS domain S-box-containing protein
MSVTASSSKSSQPELPLHRQLRWNLVFYFVLLAVLPIAIVVSVLLARVSTQIREQVVDQLESVASLKSQQISNWLSDAGMAMDTILAGQGRQNLFAEIAFAPVPDRTKQETANAVLAEAVQANTNFTELFLYNIRGQVIASSDPNQVGKVVTRQPFFTNSLTGNVTQPPYYELSSGDLTMVITRPVRSSSGNIVGVLAGRLNLDALAAIMSERAGLGETGETYLVSAESNYLLTPSRFEGYPLTHAYHSEGIDSALQGENGVGLYLNYRQPPARVLGVYRWVPELQAALLAEQEQAEALSGAARARDFSIGSAILAAMAAIAVGYLTVSRVTHPITILTETATRIAEGDLSERAEVKEENEIGLLASAFNTMADQLQDMIGTLEHRVEARTRDLQVAAEVSQQLVSVLDLDQLLPQVVELTKSSFSLYHAHVYLLDEAREWLIMTAGAGEAGRIMKERGHKIPLNAERSLVARAAREREAVIIGDVLKEPDFLPNPLLPQTRSEMAVPMILGEDVIGVLDVQSEQVDRFSKDEMLVMTTLAGQVAVAVRNARAFAQLQQAQEEAQNALLQLAYRDLFSTGMARIAHTLLKSGLSALDEALSLLGQVTGVSRVYLFENFTNSSGALCMRQTHEWVMEGITPQLDNEELQHLPYDALPHLRDVLAQGEVFKGLVRDLPEPEHGFLAEQDIRSIIVLPIYVEDEWYGFMGLDDCEQERQWSLPEIELLQTVSVAISYAISGARLLKQTQDALTQVEALYAMSQIFIGAKGPQELLEAFVGLQLTSGTYNAYMNYIYFDADGVPESSEVVGSVIRTPVPVEYPIGTRQRITSAVTQQMASGGRGITVITDVEGDSEAVSPDVAAMIRALKMRSAVSIPLIPPGGRLLGTITLTWPEPHQVSEQELQLYEAVAPQMATILENLRLYEETEAARKRFEDVALSSSDWVWEVDTEGRYTYCSDRVRDVLGYAPEEVIGKSPYEFMVPKEAERVLNLFREISANRRRIVDLENWNYRKDGTEVCLLTSGVPILDASGNLLGYRGVNKDITRQKNFERRQNLAYELGQELSTLLDLDAVLQRTIARLSEAFGYYHAHIYLLDEDGTHLTVREGLGEAGRVLKEKKHSIAISAEQSLVARAARSLKPVIVGDVTQSPDYLPNPLLPETRSEVAVPLFVGQQLLGVLDVQQNSANAFEEDEVRILLIIANQLAASIANARLFEQTQEALAETQTLYRASQKIIQAGGPEDILRALAEVVPYQDSLGLLLFYYDTDKEGQPEWAELVAQLQISGEPAMSVGTRFPVAGLALTRWLVENPHRSQHIADLYAPHDEASAEIVQTVPVGEIRSLVAIPLTIGNRRLGAIALTWQQPREFDEQELRLYDTLGPQAAALLESQRLLAETRASEQLVRSVIDASTDWIWAKDRNFRFIMVNRVMADQFFGLTPEETIGKDDYDFAPKELVDGDPARGIRGFRADDEAALRGEAVHNPYDVVRFKDGSEHILDTIKVPLYGADGNIVGVLGVGRDITERERARRRQQAAYELGQRLAALLDPQELLKETVNRLAETFEYYHTHIYLLDEEEERLVVREGLGQVGQMLREMGHAIPLDAERSLVARAGRTLEPVIVNDVSEDPDHLPNPLLPETRSEVAIPLSVGSRLLGVLDVQQNRVNAFDEDEIRTLSIIASQLAVALINAQLFAENTQRVAIMENSANAVVLGDLNGRLIYGNPVLRRLLGSIPAEEVRRHRFVELFDPEAQKYVAEVVMPAALKEGIWRGEIEVRHSDGTAFPAEVALFSIRDEQGQPRNIAAVITDITDRKQAEEALRQQEQLLRLIIDTSPDWIFVKDLQYRYLLVNKAFAEYYGGRTPEEMVGKDDYDLGTPAYLIEGDPAQGIRGFRTDDRAVLEKGEAIFNPYDVVNLSDGTLHVFETEKLPLRDVAGKVIGVLGLSRDVTEREETRRRQQAAYELARQLTSLLDVDTLLHETLVRLKETFGYYHAHVYLLDKEYGTKLVVREGLGEAGKVLKEMGHSIPLDAERSLVARAARTLEPVVVNDVAQSPDHLPNPLLPETAAEVAVPLVLGDKLLGVLDVQDNRVGHFDEDEVRLLLIVANQLAVALSNAALYLEQLETAERLRELDKLKSEFLANMSHELRTPLNSIIGYSELLIDDLGDTLDEMSLEDLKAIHSSGHHLLMIINDILDLSKIAAGRMELSKIAVDLPTFLPQVVDMSRVLLKDKPDVELRLDMPDTLPVLQADPVRLRQIVWNLLSNAIKFTDHGFVRLSCWADNDWMYIAVQDTGVGIPPEHHETVFDQFRQVDGSATRKAGGTGLGLTISRQLARLHGGDIELESEVGKGSLFTVKLPLEGAVQPAVSPAEESADGAGGNGAKRETEREAKVTGD